MWIDGHGLLVHGEGEADTMARLRTHTISCDMPNYKIAVWWKRKFHWKKVSELGDGMDVLVIYERSPHPFVLDYTKFFDGLSLYRMYDETTNEREVSLYKYSKRAKDREKLQELLKTRMQHLTIISEDGRLILQGVDVQGAVDMSLSATQHSAIWSFLFGLTLSYGKVDIHPRIGMPSRILIQLPMVGPLMQHEDSLLTICRNIQDQGMMLKVDILSDTKSGSRTLQISCHDPEILYAFAQTFPMAYTQDEELMPYTKTQRALLGWDLWAQLLPFIEQHGGDETRYERLRKSVLKKRTK